MPLGVPRKRAVKRCKAIHIKDCSAGNCTVGGFVYTIAAGPEPVRFGWSGANAPKVSICSLLSSKSKSARLLRMRSSFVLLAAPRAPFGCATNLDVCLCLGDVTGLRHCLAHAAELHKHIKCDHRRIHGQPLLVIEVLNNLE